MTPCMNKAWMYIMKPFGADDIGLAFNSYSRSKNAGQGDYEQLKEWRENRSFDA